MKTQMNQYSSGPKNIKKAAIGLTTIDDLRTVIIDIIEATITETIKAIISIFLITVV